MSDTPQDAPSHIRIVMESIHLHANDGQLDHDEVAQLIAIAEADGSISDDERRVLGDILDELDAFALTPELKAGLARLRGQVAAG